ncbi:MAG: DUF3617 family protein [Deltaproteobacteria bacterium]|nr:DUF3617 family protein [Deltaproteobacteria bacterium]
MTRSLNLLIATIILSLSVVGCQSEPKVNIKEGQWKITTNVKMTGIPMQMPPFTTTQCITKDDLVPKTSQPNQPDQNTKITNLKITGNTVSYDISSKTQGGEMVGHSTVTYNGDKMTGTMTAKVQPGNMEMSYTMKGHRIGDCPK